MAMATVIPLIPNKDKEISSHFFFSMMNTAPDYC